jgi:hypothetical protein
MIFSTAFSLALLLLTHVAHALPHAESSTRSTTVLATYDATYDNPSGSLNGVACSNGANGLVTNYPTFSSLPTYPFIGGAPGVTWNSPNCGGCWKLTSTTTGAWIIYTAIDSSSGFNIAEDAFVAINGGQIGQGTLEVDAEQVPRYLCGL